jgi:signal transduction histidine kinase
LDLVPPTERALESLRATSDLSRRIIADLRPVLLEDFGLAKALDAYCGAFEAKTAIKCERKLDSDLPQLEEEMSIALFRIVQESLSNVAKYARAATVRVTLARSDDALKVSVEDDGVGVTNAALAKAHAHGVLGMRERAYELGADFHIGAGLGGRGTGVHVAMPLMADPGTATAA